MNNMTSLLFIFTIFSAFGNVVLSLFEYSILRIYSKEKGITNNKINKTPPLNFGLKIFYKSGWKNLYLLTKFTNQIITLAFICSFLFFLSDIGASKLVSLFLICISLIIIKITTYLISKRFHNRIFHLSSLLSAIFIYILFPISNLFLMIYNASFSKESTNKILSTLDDINIDKS